VLAEDVAVGIDVLTDIVMNPLLTDEDLEKEKGVILEEIKQSEDDPAEHVHEIHFSERWGDHPLGKPIIGNRESVSNFKRPDLLRYMERQYRAENILLSVAGHVDPAKFKALAEERLEKLPKKADQKEPERPRGIQKIKEVPRDIEQVHFCIGTDSCSLYELDDLYITSVLNGILGGGMSSRLFQEIREKRGLVYAVGSYNASYGAGGAFCVYGGTSLEAWPLVQELVRVELDKLMKGELEVEELEKVKKNLSGNLVLGLEAMSARMLRMARNEMFYKREITVEETLERIAAVTRDQVIEKANKIFPEDLISTTALGPFQT
jgi:predicted Zn-dependent peptidase